MTAQLDQIVAALRVLLAPELLLGVTVEAVFDSHGGSPDALGLWALSGDAAHRIQPIRLSAAAAGNEGGSKFDGLSTVIDQAGALMLFGDEQFPVDALVAELAAQDAPLSVSAGLPHRRGFDGRFVLIDDAGMHRSGAVGLWIPEELALFFWFDTQRWDDDDPVPDPPVQPQDSAGAILIAGRRADVSGMASFDLEVLYDDLPGAVVGMIGRPYYHDRSEPAGQRPLGPESVTAAVYGR